MYQSMKELKKLSFYMSRMATRGSIWRCLRQGGFLLPSFQYIASRGAAKSNSKKCHVMTIAHAILNQSRLLPSPSPSHSPPPSSPFLKYPVPLKSTLDNAPPSIGTLTPLAMPPVVVIYSDLLSPCRLPNAHAVGPANTVGSVSGAPVKTVTLPPWGGRKARLLRLFSAMKASPARSRIKSSPFAFVVRTTAGPVAVPSMGEIGILTREPAPVLVKWRKPSRILTPLMPKGVVPVGGVFMVGSSMAMATCLVWVLRR